MIQNTLVRLPLRSLMTTLSFLGAYMAIAQTSSALSQEAPGGVGTPAVWYSGGDMPTTIGNHRTIDLLAAKDELSDVQKIYRGARTAFLVLMPNGEGSGQRFAKLDKVSIYDDHVDLLGEKIEMDFKKGVPTILAFQTPSQDIYAWRSAQGIEIENEGSFAMAEMILFPRALSREELRKVNSYLALKYSITITENDDNDWRDYLSPSNDHYWDKQIDERYDIRVLGLGRSDEQKFYQSQTVSNTGSEIWFSLNHFEEKGEMPEADVEDGSFIVLSERDSLISKSGNCTGTSKGSLNPMERWKFQFRNWQSDEESLWVRVKMPEDVNREDSLFVYNGQEQQYLPVEAEEGMYWLYRVRLKELSGAGQYFFVTGSRMNCLEDMIEVVDNQLIVRNRESEVWGVEILSISDGLTVGTVVSEEVFATSLESGQYIVRIMDEDGNEKATKVVNVTGSDTDDMGDARNPEIKMYPNPVESGMVSKLHISNLNGQEQVLVLVTDATGRAVIRKTIDYQDAMELPVVLQTPGLYHVIIRQGSWAYSLKHIVSTSK